MVVIQDKMKVSIAYTLREGKRILEEVPASQPFVYIHGYNNIIPGLEDALTGRRLGEKFFPQRILQGSDIIQSAPAATGENRQ